METNNFIPNEKKAELLDDFLDKYSEPAFGCLPKTEIDMLVFELFENTGRIKRDSNQYTLSKTLKISQARAKNLLYNKTVRKYKDEDLEKMTKCLLQNPIAQKNESKQFLFHVENPLLIEYIRNKIHSLGYISDGSFSPFIIKLPIEALAALIECFILDKNEASKTLKSLDISDGSLKSFLIEVLKSSAKTLATQIAGEMGNVMAEKTLDYLPNLWQNNVKTVSEQIKKLSKQICSEKKADNRA